MANRLEMLENKLRHQQLEKCNLVMRDCRMDCTWDSMESRLVRTDCRKGMLDCMMVMLGSRMGKLGNNLEKLGNNNLGYLEIYVLSSLVNLGSKKAKLASNLGMLDCNLETLDCSLEKSDCMMD